MKIKKIFALILAILMLVSSIPIAFAEGTEAKTNDYKLHKDLIFDYVQPVGDKANEEFEKVLKSFTIEKPNTYTDDKGIKYTFSFKDGFAELESVVVPPNMQEYTLPASVTLYYFVAASEAPKCGSEITEEENRLIVWDMPVGVILCKREVEINKIDTKLLGSVEAPKIVLSENIALITAKSFNTDIGMGLKEIYAPSVEVVGKNAFTGCSSLTTVYMPKLRRVDEAAFSECVSLKTFTFDKLQSIGKYAFLDCASLKTVSLPKTVTYLNEGAFYGCTALESITIPSGIQINALPKACFYSCTNLKEITLPYEIIVVSESAFSGCANLNVINFINTNVSTIGKQAFFGCLRLETAYLPSSLVSVQANSFESCPNLRFVYFDSSLTDAQITAFNKAGFGEKIVTEKDTSAPEIKILDNKELVNAPSEIASPPTTLTVTDALDVEKVTVKFEKTEIKATSRVTKINSYATKVWDIPLTESGEYEITAVDAIGNKVTKKIKFTNTEIIITKEDVSVELDEVYDSLPVHPPVTVTKNGKHLKQDTHYTVEYKNADKEGAAQIIIKGIVPYKGEVVINYEIKKNPILLGDINKDGTITASDARFVLRMAAMLEAYDEEQKQIADITGDGAITSSDARKILRISAMLE